jgi:hypothetical protein
LEKQGVLEPFLLSSSFHEPFMNLNRPQLPRTPPSLEQVQESTMPVQVVRFSLLGNGLPEFFGVPYITSVSSHEEVHDVAKRMAEDRIDVDVDDLLETRSALVSNHSSRVTYVDEVEMADLM